jgi:hypothetical protein
MNTDKKNQHYIPKFYLRYFSYEGNQKQIGVHNYKSDFTFPTAKLKTQGSKNFYYGEDGIVEDLLSEIEGKLSNTIKLIRESETLPSKESNDHYNLLHFIALTHLRNPLSINHSIQSMAHLKSQLKQLHPEHETDHLVPQTSHEEAIDMALSTIRFVAKNMLDLDFKLLKNETKTPFITSDFPIVKYNQFLEQKKWNHGKTGYGIIGLQILIPLSDTICIIFYDSSIYKIGNKKSSILSVTNTKDIDSLNLLQFTNCFESIFFSDKASIDYIKKLKLRSVRYPRANEINSRTHFLQENEKIPEKENLVIIGSTDNEINLQVDGIKIHALGKKRKLLPTVGQYRPWPAAINREKYR